MKPPLRFVHRTHREAARLEFEIGLHRVVRLDEFFVRLGQRHARSQGFVSVSYRYVFPRNNTRYRGSADVR